jgi:hypothetical protein
VLRSTLQKRLARTDPKKRPRNTDQDSTNLKLRQRGGALKVRPNTKEINSMPVPIRYYFVRSSSWGAYATVGHLLNAAEMPLLRCLMTLLLLPADTNDLVRDRMPFTAATRRMQFPPSFRTLLQEIPPPAEWFETSKKEALKVFLIAGSIPAWLQGIAEDSHIGILTQTEEVLELAKSNPRLHVGLLKGNLDLPEAYRVFRELLTVAASNIDYSQEVRSISQGLAEKDLLSERPRLDFFPPLPLPPPNEGRSATYLINRFSNNVDVAGISLEGPSSAFAMPQMLEWCRLAGGAFSYLETGGGIPSWLPVERSELETTYQQVSSDSENRDSKFHVFLNLGLKMTRGKHLRRPFYTLGVC